LVFVNVERVLGAAGGRALDQGGRLDRGASREVAAQHVRAGEVILDPRGCLASARTRRTSARTGAATAAGAAARSRARSPARALTCVATGCTSSGTTAATRTGVRRLRFVVVRPARSEQQQCE